jgi:HSP20 family protein
MLSFNILDELSCATNPWRDSERLRRDLGQLLPFSFNPFVSRDRTPLNIYAGDNGVKVVVSVPGWEAEWFDLSVKGNKLHLRGETKFEAVENAEEPIQETLNRVVTLPYRVADDKVQATYRNGLLTIDMVRSEQDRPKKIAIVAA